MNRWAKRTDKNQKEIVKALRAIPGVTVSTDKDDIIVGFQQRNFWYEIKSERSANKKGKIFESEKRDSQKDLEKNWTGHYKVVASLAEILLDMGILSQV